MVSRAAVETVLGEPVKEAKETSPPGGKLRIAQCVFVGTSPSKAVSVALAEANPADPAALTPREYWRRQFHPTDPDEDSEAMKPRKIAGLGTEAFWVGNSITGALYVLRGSSFLRISVGGIREEQARIRKSVTLARAARQ